MKRIHMLFSILFLFLAPVSYGAENTHIESGDQVDVNLKIFIDNLEAETLTEDVLGRISSFSETLAEWTYAGVFEDSDYGRLIKEKMQKLIKRFLERHNTQKDSEALQTCAVSIRALEKALNPEAKNSTLESSYSNTSPFVNNDTNQFATGSVTLTTNSLNVQAPHMVGVAANSNSAVQTMYPQPYPQVTYPPQLAYPQPMMPAPVQTYYSAPIPYPQNYQTVCLPQQQPIQYAYPQQQYGYPSVVIGYPQQTYVCYQQPAPVVQQQPPVIHNAQSNLLDESSDSESSHESESLRKEREEEEKIKKIQEQIEKEDAESLETENANIIALHILELLNGEQTSTQNDLLNHDHSTYFNVPGMGDYNARNYYSSISLGGSSEFISAEYDAETQTYLIKIKYTSPGMLFGSSETEMTFKVRDRMTVLLAEIVKELMVSPGKYAEQQQKLLNHEDVSFFHDTAGQISIQIKFKNNGRFNYILGGGSFEITSSLYNANEQGYIIKGTYINTLRYRTPMTFRIKKQ